MTRQGVQADVRFPKSKVRELGDGWCKLMLWKGEGGFVRAAGFIVFMSPWITSQNDINAVFLPTD